MRSERLGSTLLPKRLALPAFASDALSSVAYAPDEVLLTLAIAGVTVTMISPWIGLAVVIVMLTVVASYRQTVRAYPSGGGDYEVATENLGKHAGLTVASALMVDYVLTVAVSISSAAQYVAAVIPAADGHEVGIAVSVVVVLALINLRGLRESGRGLAVPVYLYMASIGLMALVGLFQNVTGSLRPAESAGFDILPAAGYEQGLVGLAGALLVLRAFSSGSAALTGIEAISNGVPHFRRPKSHNAATTLLLLGLISATMLMSVLLLARATGVRFVAEPADQLLLNGVPVGDAYVQHPVIGQIAEAVFHDAPILFGLVTVVTGLILALAANTAFNGFPVLSSILARDGYLPRQLYTRGDRLAFSNGILVLAAAAIVLIVTFNAEVTQLIQLYIVGVFISFTVSQTGMVRHWTRRLRVGTDPAERSRIRRARAVNTFGLAMTGVVLVIVLITKFTHGAWITLLLMVALYIGMNGVRRHYDAVAQDLEVPDVAAARALPSRVHGIVLISKLHQPAMRAISYARATRPSTLEAVTVEVDPAETETLRRTWEGADIPVPLTVLDAPFRDITRPVVNYVLSVRRESPRDLVVVFVPEYVVEHWWERLLHNKSAARLKSRLHRVPGVILASVPFQIHEADDLAAHLVQDEP